MLKQKDVIEISFDTLSSEESKKIERMALVSALSFSEKHNATIKEKIKNNIDGYTSEVLTSKHVQEQHPALFQKASHEDFNFESLPFYERIKDLTVDKANAMKDSELKELQKLIRSDIKKSGEKYHRHDVDIFFKNLQIDIKNSPIYEDKSLFYKDGFRHNYNYQVYKDRAERKPMDGYIQTFTDSINEKLYIAGYMPSETLVNKDNLITRHSKYGKDEGTYRESPELAHPIEKMNDLVLKEEESKTIDHFKFAMKSHWNNLNFLNKFSFEEKAYYISHPKLSQLSEAENRYLFELLPEVLKEIPFLEKNQIEEIHDNAFKISKEELSDKILEMKNEQNNPQERR